MDRGRIFPTTFGFQTPWERARQCHSGALVVFNFRFSTAVTVDELQQRFAEVLMNCRSI